MSKILIVNKRKLYISVLALALLLAAIIYLFKGDKNAADMEVFLASAAQESNVRTIHMVTGEFKSTLQDGTEIESYIWHPGTIPVRKGEQVNLKIYGVNGAQHNFIIEGINVKGTVNKGEETTVSFKADKEGIYRIICTDHPIHEHRGPMIAYIVVF